MKWSFLIRLYPGGWQRTEIKTMGDQPKESYITPSELEILKKQHEKELQQLKEENEILKMAMHIFTKNQA